MADISTVNLRLARDSCCCCFFLLLCFVLSCLCLVCNAYESLPGKHMYVCVCVCVCVCTYALLSQAKHMWAASRKLIMMLSMMSASPVA